MEKFYRKNRPETGASQFDASCDDWPEGVFMCMKNGKREYFYCRSGFYGSGLREFSDGGWLIDGAVIGGIVAKDSDFRSGYSNEEFKKKYEPVDG